jgi:hypothetical protein
MSEVTPYDTDFVAWADEQAALLRQRRFESLDLDNLTLEVEALAHRYRERAGDYLRNICDDLLKLGYGEPSVHEGYRQRIAEGQRRELSYLLDDYPSLRDSLPALLKRVYPRSNQDAHRELSHDRYSHAPFPETCPWTLEQILAHDFWPER